MGIKIKQAHLPAKSPEVPTNLLKNAKIRCQENINRKQIDIVAYEESSY